MSVENGKPSGAARRKEKRLKSDAELDSETGGGEAFDVLGEPDLDDPATALEYVRRAQLIAFSQICKSRTLPQRERWRLIKELSAVVGMTSNRSALESRTAKLEKMLKAKQQAGAVRDERGPVAKPATARGQRRPPKIVPADAPDEEPKKPE